MRENKGGISLFQKEISLPLTHPEKIALPACSSKGCSAWGVEVLCVAALLRSPPLVLLYDLPLLLLSAAALPILRRCSLISFCQNANLFDSAYRGERSNAAPVGTCKSDKIQSRRRLRKTNDTQAERHPQGVCRIRKAAKLPTAAQQRIIGAEANRVAVLTRQRRAQEVQSASIAALRAARLQCENLSLGGFKGGYSLL